MSLVGLFVICFDVASQGFTVLCSLSTIAAALLQAEVDLHMPQQVSLFSACFMTHHTTPNSESICIHYLSHWLGYLLIQLCKDVLCMSFYRDMCLCELLTCARRLPLDLNIFPHILHSIWRFPRWLASMWSFKFVDTLDVFPHSIHCQT